MFVEHLRQELTTRCRKNPNYSIRSFAKHLKVDSSTLAKVLKGSRQLTPKLAHRLLEELELNPLEKKDFMISVIKQTNNQNQEHIDTFSTIDFDTFEIISSWEHYAILSFLEIKNKPGNVSTIANVFGINPSIVLDSLKRLEKLGLVRFEKSKWIYTPKQLTTPSDIPNATLRKANREYIERALYSLERHGVEERDITGITMAISKEKLPEAKKMIKKFRRDLCKFLEAGTKDEVYRLNIQLYPLKK